MNKDTIYLKIPGKPNYISVARLTTSSIVNSMGLGIDEIEDIKVSIAEACINTLHLNPKKDISIIYNIDEEKISITVEGVVENIPEELDESKERNLGVLIIKSLMDEVRFGENGIEMIKYIE